MYSTILDLQLHFSPAFLTLTADDNRDGSLDTTVLTQAIVEADQRIDVLLGLVYVTPFAAPIPALVNELSSILAGQNLARRVPSSTVIVYRGDFSRAASLLDLLAQGKVLLPGAERRTRSISIDPPAEERVFSTCTLEGF